ncbi:MAG: phosphate transport system protein [Euryarchaeota archaeon]|nr:phosphate transport system protein [Euryarchaeota archaeon]
MRKFGGWKMPRERYLIQLELLKESMASFGDDVGKAFRDSMVAVIDLDIELAKRTLAFESEVDKREEELEVTISDLIALQQPMASDLRLVISSLKISADLKRIVGLSINIAKIPGRIEGGHIKPLLDTKRMADIAAYMIENSIKAFRTQDVELARVTAARDDEVDKIFYSVWVELVEMMAKDTSIISKATNLLFLIRYIERIADHCCNICESVIYLSTAERVKLN